MVRVSDLRLGLLAMSGGASQKRELSSPVALHGAQAFLNLCGLPYSRCVPGIDVDAIQAELSTSGFEFLFPSFR